MTKARRLDIGRISRRSGTRQYVTDTLAPASLRFGRLSCCGTGCDAAIMTEWGQVCAIKKAGFP